MANFEAEITEINIQDDSYGHIDVAAELSKTEDLIKVKIDSLVLNIDLNIGMALVFELARVLEFKLTDLEK